MQCRACNADAWNAVHAEREGERERKRERERERERERVEHMHRHRHTDTDTDTDTHIHTRRTTVLLALQILDSGCIIARTTCKVTGVGRGINNLGSEAPTRQTSRVRLVSNIGKRKVKG
jgi:hypothetical protein